MSAVPEKVMNEFFEGNELKPGFSGIGKLRGRTDYTSDEEVIINHFFTRSDSNVYAATDNMPGELWALFMGQYARSPLTARDRLIQLFREIPEKDSSAPTLEDIASMISRQEDLSSAISSHLKNAGKFIDTFGVSYGHASLRDSGTVRMCFEGVSQRATKFLEAAREGAYQEQSTRATPFSMENIGVPLEIRGTKYEERMLELDGRAIELYEEIRKILPVHLAAKYSNLRTEADGKIKKELGDYTAKLPDGLWEKVVNEKTFDIARSLLPQNITTSLGMTLNTRRFMDMLTEWQSSEPWEIQVLGRAAQIESMKVSPTLMKYGNPSEFHRGLPQKRRDLFAKFIGTEKEMDYRSYPIQSKLIAGTSGLEDWVLASILFNGSDGKLSMDEIRQQVFLMTPEQRREIAKSQVEGKEDFEIHTKAMEIGSFVFERLYDIGAYRDLHRQRGDRQQITPYAVVGYHMPFEIAEIGLYREFVSLMNDVKVLYDDLKKDGLHAVSEYVPLMANVIRHVATKDPVQAFYEARLRAQAAGADSYRTIARQEAHMVFDALPSFKGLIYFDDREHPLNRLEETVNGFIRRKKNS